MLLPESGVLLSTMGGTLRSTTGGELLHKCSGKGTLLSRAELSALGEYLLERCWVLGWVCARELLNSRDGSISEYCGKGVLLVVGIIVYVLGCC